MERQASSEDLPRAVADEKKRRRLISNRESARRSRMRKKQNLHNLARQVSQLQYENNHITQAYIELNHRLQTSDSEKKMLKAHVVLLKSLLKLVRPETPDYLPEPGSVLELQEVPSLMVRDAVGPDPTINATETSNSDFQVQLSSPALEEVSVPGPEIDVFENNDSLLESPELSSAPEQWYVPWLEGEEDGELDSLLGPLPDP